MRKTIHNWHLHIATMLTAFVLFLSTSVAAAYVQPLYLEINQSTLFNASSYADIIRVAIANPAIADVNVINNRTFVSAFTCESSSYSALRFISSLRSEELFNIKY